MNYNEVQLLLPTIRTFIHFWADKSFIKLIW